MQRTEVTAIAPQSIEEARADPSRGLAKLALTLIETLKELMERQARRRVLDGSLSQEETERLGLAFMQLNQKIASLSLSFGLKREELTLGLAAPLMSTESPQQGSFQEFTLVDLLDRVVEKGVVLFGDLGLSVAEVELINVQLRLAVGATKQRGRSRATPRSIAHHEDSYSLERGKRQLKRNNSSIARKKAAGKPRF